MAQKKKSEVNKDIEYIKDLLETDKLVIGSKIALKGLKEGLVSKIYLAKNAPENMVDDVNHYAELSQAQVVQLGIDNEELGVVCRKPFLISVVSVLK